MARDTELDRLKAAQDLAFQRKQRAYETMQAAWQHRSSARDEMNRAFEAKQRAHEVQEASWQNYQQVKRANGPRIDQLNRQQEAAYQNMRRAFDNASMAYDRRDGAAARSHADDGHAFKAEAQRCVEERRRLVAEIRAARDCHAGPKVDFQRAKADFTAAKQRFDQAKAEHERVKDEFQRAKREFDAARQAFKARLEKVRAERNRRREDKRAIAERAGVPSQYLDDLWVSRDSNGSTNIYFGGVGKPNGPGHGHYVIDRNGRVTYRRNPNESHGSQNFTSSKREQRDGAASLYVRRARTGRSLRGVNEHGGVFYDRRDYTEGEGTKLHVTEYYDGSHVSWDATPSGDVDIHWTDHSVNPGDPVRHVPPPDARFGGKE